MSTVLEPPEIELVDTDFHAFNCAVWERLCSDSILAALEYRIETDRHGQIVVSPPPAPSHGNKQIKLGATLENLSKSGQVIAECPISTREGVKAADIAWCSDSLWDQYGEKTCFMEAPEICVEILSPSNTKGEIEEKKTLYFEVGASEVWICHLNGAVDFFHSANDSSESKSRLIPEFPNQIV